MAWVRSSWAIGCAVAMVASSATAATQFNWNPALTGTQNWTTNGHWDQAGFPNGSTHVANLSVPLAASLTVDLGSSEITLAGLNIGGAGGAVSSMVANGRIVFRNDDSTFNNGNAVITAAGAADGTSIVDTIVDIDNESLEFSAASSSSVALPATWKPSARRRPSAASCPAGCRQGWTISM